METSCPICYQEYNLSTRLPRVTLVCGHSLCSSCLSSIIQDPYTSRCPLDKSQLPSGSNIERFPVNFALKEILESRPQADSCPDHGDELISFCLTDQRRICAVCIEEEHRGHQTRAFKSIKGRTAKYRKQLADLCQDIKEANEQADEMVEKERNVLMRKIDEDYTALLQVLAYKKQYLTTRTNLLLNKEKMRIRSLLGQNSTLSKDISRKDLSLQQILRTEDVLQIEEAPNAILNFTDQYQSLMGSDIRQEKMEEEFRQIEQSIESYCLQPNLVLDQREKLKPEDLLTVLKVETHFSFEFENDSLTMRNDQKNSQEVEIDTKKIIGVQSAAFIFDESVSPNDLELLTFIWGSFSVLVGLKLGFANDTLVEQLYNIFCSNYYKLQRIEIDITGYGISERSRMISFLRNIFLRAKNVNAVKLTMDDVVADHGVFEKIFEGGIFDTNELEEFTLSLTGQTVEDKVFKQIFVQMPQLKKLNLILNGPNITDETIICCAQNTLASAKFIQALYLDLSETIVTDAGIEHLCRNLNSKKLIELQLEFGGTQITDKTAEIVSQRLVDLDLFDALEALWLGFSQTNISDNGIMKLFKPIPNVKDFRLALSLTTITDAAIYELILRCLASIKAPQKYLLYLGDTKISDECFDELLKSLKDAKEIDLGFEHTAISEKTIESFVDKKLSVESICEVLKIDTEGTNIRAAFQEKINQLNNKKSQENNDI